MPVTVSQCYVG